MYCVQSDGQFHRKRSGRFSMADEYIPCGFSIHPQQFMITSHPHIQEYVVLIRSATLSTTNANNFRCTTYLQRMNTYRPVNLTILAFDV